MTDEKTIRVTNQDELDAALAEKPDDDTVIKIHSDPGTYTPNYIFIDDSRGHAVEACGKSRVVAFGVARLTARGHSIVTVRGEAFVHATDFSQVDWHDDSTGKCGYYARGQVWDEAAVTTSALCPLFAHDDSEVTARGSARVIADGNASVTAHDETAVEISDDVDVTAYCRAVVYSEGGTVRARDHVTVHAHYDTRVEGEEDVVVHVFTPGVIVTGEATVIGSVW